MGTHENILKYYVLSIAIGDNLHKSFPIPSAYYEQLRLSELGLFDLCWGLHIGWPVMEYRYVDGGWVRSVKLPFSLKISQQIHTQLAKITCIDCAKQQTCTIMTLLCCCVCKISLPSYFLCVKTFMDSANLENSLLLKISWFTIKLYINTRHMYSKSVCRCTYWHFISSPLNQRLLRDITAFSAASSSRNWNKSNWYHEQFNLC